MKKFLGLGSIFSFFFVAAPMLNPVHAQDNLICTIFPFLGQIGAFGISDICGGLDPDRPIDEARSLIQFGLNLVFVGIIILAIYIIVKAAINYIRSEGDDEKIKSANKSIKAVFTGIIALFVGILGIILVLAIFNATGAVNNEVPDALQLDGAGGTTGITNQGGNIAQ